MKKLFWLATACLCLFPGVSHAQTADPEARYQALLTAAKSGAGPVDWQALRYAYAERKSFDGQFKNDDREAMFKAGGRGDWAGELAAAKRVLDKNYVDGMAHFALGAAEIKLGDADAGAREEANARAIWASIKTGDGLSFDHAFTVIAIDEEYDLFITMGIKPGTQGLNNHDGHVYDVFETSDTDGKPVTYYFNIDREWAAETRPFQALKDGSAKP